MPTSTIPAVKAALVDQLAAMTAEGGALENASVTWGVPPSRPPRDWVLVGNVTTDQSDAAIGQQKRDETYQIDIAVSVVRGIREQQRVVTERAFEIVEVIETLLRPLTQPPLGVGNVIWIKVVKTDLQEAFDEQSREALVLLSIDVKARI